MDQNGLRIVIRTRDGGASIGIEKEGADPSINAVEGTLEEVLARVPHLVTVAQDTWAESPRHPKHEGQPPSSPSPAPSPARAAGRTPTPRPPEAEQQQLL